MKRLIYLLLPALFFVTACGDDEPLVPNDGPTQGLTAHYFLDGSAIDNVGGNDGQLFGPVATTDRLGNPGGALEFDGINDYVAIPNAVANNFGSDDDFALSLWVRFGEQIITTRNTNTIIEKFYRSEDNTLSKAYPYAIRMWNRDGQLPGTVFARRQAGRENNNCNELSGVHATDVALNDDTYHHIVFQRFEGNLELHLDGELADVQIDSSAIVDCTTRNTEPIHLGSRYSPGGESFHHWKGSMDDFRIYNRALTAAEISWLASN